MQTRRLYRSETDRRIGGVCGGIAEYYQIDVTLVRLLTVLIALSAGVGVLVYIIACIVIPTQSRVAPVASPAAGGESPAEGRSDDAPSDRTQPRPTAGGGAVWVGVILIALGAIFLLDNMGLLWWWRWNNLWPLLLVVIGLALLLRRR